MPPVPTAQPDGPKIRQLIMASRPDARTFADAARPLARRLGRHPMSLYVMTGRADKPAASKTFIRQLAGELGVKPSEISDMTDDEDDAAPAAIAS